MRLKLHLKSPKGGKIMSSHIDDIADMYVKTRQRSFHESVRDAQVEIHAAHKDSRYYMCMPRDYIIKRGMRLLLAFMVCVLGCYSLLTVAIPPMFLIVFLKWKNYCHICASMNISPRKLNILLAGWLAVCIILNLVFWDLLTKIL